MRNIFSALITNLEKKEETAVMQTNQSQVAVLLNQIASEYIAAQRGLTGLAISATHEVINARMGNIGKLHEDLQIIVGDEAGKLVAQRLEAIPE